MDGSSDIRIVGIDENRYPRIRKAPYIDLFFKLSRQAPREWCDFFNDFGKKIDPGAKVDKTQGLYIEAWVRDMELIPVQFDRIRKAVEESNERYAEYLRRLQLAESGGTKAGSEDARQARLNAILAGLRFED